MTETKPKLVVLCDSCYQGDTFLQSTVTTDEIWVDHFTPESKSTSKSNGESEA